MIVINDREKIKWKKNITVSDVLKKMGYDFALITVTIDGELVSEEDYQSYFVPDNADMNVFHLAHGG